MSAIAGGHECRRAESQPPRPEERREDHRKHRRFDSKNLRLANYPMVLNRWKTIAWTAMT